MNSTKASIRGFRAADKSKWKRKERDRQRGGKERNRGRGGEEGNGEKVETRVSLLQARSTFRPRIYRL